MSVLAAPPFAVDNPIAQHKRLVAAGLLLNWLGAYPGKNWQARWLSAEAGVAGLGWRRVLASWLAGQGHHISWHLDYLSAVALRRQPGRAAARRNPDSAPQHADHGS